MLRLIITDLTLTLTKISSIRGKNFWQALCWQREKLYGLYFNFFRKKKMNQARFRRTISYIASNAVSKNLSDHSLQIYLMQKERKIFIKKHLSLLSIDLINILQVNRQISYWVDLTPMETIYLSFQSTMFILMIEISFLDICGEKD